MENYQSKNLEASNSALLTDMYELTMAQGYFHNQKANHIACFYMFFREYPFHGGYAIACGIEEIADYIENFKFTEQDIKYLASVKDSTGGQLLAQDFLDYLSNLKLDVNIDCVEEGTIVFPHEPVLRVTGPILHCQLIETALLNAFNFETLIATKASRICFAANCPIIEFGLRRAQGYSGGLWASRASVVGGCVATSNVEAGRKYNIPVSGTHAHS